MFNWEISDKGLRWRVWETFFWYIEMKRGSAMTRFVVLKYCKKIRFTILLFTADDLVH